MAETLTEEESPVGSHRVGTIAVVLRYDDLLADDPGVFLLPRSPLRVTRGEASPKVRLVDDEVLELPDSWVSSQHAVIEPTAEGYQIVDRGSRNGTHVSGQRIHAPTVLQDGDLVEIGHTLLCYRWVERRLVDAVLAAPRGGVRFGPTTTRAPELAEVVRQLEAIAATPEPVLILGETGSGKEIAARALHEWSGRQGAFRAIDCGAIPEGMFESVLFGHHRGAFTGAETSRTGELVLADRGTLMLDEVANMGGAAQAKFLRCLETGVVTPLGTSEQRAVDVRVISATNSEILSDSQTFRPDLLSRLAGLVVRLPPLRKRREDLGVLVRHFLGECGVSKASIRGAAARKLFCSDFPGNVRQLRAILRSASVLAGEGPMELSHLPPEALKTSVAPQSPTKPGAEQVVAALREARGNVVQAARALGVHARQLYRWMERWEIDPDAYRQGKE